MQFMWIHDRVEENGKTVRENKLAIPHTIKIGSLVEIKEPDPDSDNEELYDYLYLVMHIRDANGHPLNLLSSTLEDMDEKTRDFSRMTIGYRDEDLIVIK